ncbi:MAG: tetratricopeptide repeat protein [Candidatus Neomarinimicrobiota bacterium]
MNRRYLLPLILFITISMVSCQKKVTFTSSSTKALTYFQQADDLFYKVYYDNALTLYKKSFAADTSFALAAFRIAQTLNILGKPDSSVAYLKKAGRLANSASDFERLLINRYQADFSGDKDLADLTLDTLIRKFPDNINVQILTANRKEAVYDFDGARRIYLNILKQNPNYVLAYNYIGYLYAKKGLFKEALKYFNLYREYAPEQLNPYDSMAEIFIATGRYYEAIRILEPLFKTHQAELAKQNYLGSLIYLRLANAYLQLGQYQKALSIITEALRTYQDENIRLNLYLNRFLIHYTLKQPVELINDKNQIKSVSDDKYLILFVEGLTHLTAGQSSLAMKSNRQLKESSTEASQNYQKRILLYSAFLSGEINLQSEQFDQAAENFRMAAAYNDSLNNVYYRLMRAVAEGKGGHTATALKELGAILSCNPNHAPALIYSAQFYYDSDHPAEARFYLNYFLDVWKNADADSPLMQVARKLSTKLSGQLIK